MPAKPATSGSNSKPWRAWTMPAKLQEYRDHRRAGNKVQMAVNIVSDGAVVPVVIP